MQTAEKARGEEKRAVVVNGRIPKVCADRIAAILRVDLFEILFDIVESFVPTMLRQPPGMRRTGCFQPVFRP